MAARDENSARRYPVMVAALAFRNLRMHPEAWSWHLLPVDGRALFAPKHERIRYVQQPGKPLETRCKSGMISPFI